MSRGNYHSDDELDRAAAEMHPVSIVDLRVDGAVTYYQTLGGQLADMAFRFADPEDIRACWWRRVLAWNLTLGALCTAAGERARFVGEARTAREFRFGS